MFDWISPRTMDRAPGNQGTVVLLADRSSSMCSMAIEQCDKAIPLFMKAIPGLRVFAFHAGYKEVTDFASKHGGLGYSAPRQGVHKSFGRYVNSTYLGACLESIARLQPSKTIVLSDGGVADGARALHVADRMSGVIDCFYCHSSWCDRSFMEELARRGRGRFSQYSWLDGAAGPAMRLLKGSLQSHLQPPVVQQGRAHQQAVAIPQARITVRPGATVRLQAPTARPMQITDQREVPMQPLREKVKKGWFW